MYSRHHALVAFSGVLGFDIATKVWAAAALAEPVRIADWLYLMLHRNSGMFLGTIPVSEGYWICVFGATVWFGWRALCTPSAPVAICLGAILAGLTGNAIGQARGGVVDFIGIGPITGDAWLVANVADFALVGGGLALGLYLLCRRLRRARGPKRAETGADGDV